MHGTPVKSCISTRAGVNWISMLGSAEGSQLAMAWMWSLVMLAPSSVRNRFSASTLRLYGQLFGTGYRVQAVDLVALDPRQSECRGHQMS